MTESVDVVVSDRALKSKHRAMWGLGDYPAVASQVIPDLGPVLVQACEVGEGDRVLDIAAGAGNAAIPAAARGAEVVATDLTPELFEAGKRAAAEADVELEWKAADAEDLPFVDGEFDVVLSCVGVMFAPHHQRAADELLRVCRVGGRVGVLSWTPTGFIGEMFKVMKPYAPAPPTGVQPAPLWGDENHVRGLFGDLVGDVDARRKILHVDRFGGPEEFRGFFKANYGPTIAVYRNIADDRDRTEALDRELVELARRYDNDDSSFSMDWEYLLVTGVRGV
ncbi:class I SAM-dependent methyltransferase [Rhodococcus sp. ARC_M6]|uniref:class I SAM-dependent methyltransferase n=1 Tax=Rhodococcus sp. ARC_M6 TaxID=2928852 RepID=UPI001FB1DDDF|nr:methyltransferase domain-containing protein [Rhodococcus sp. ARC_M6]MCJ0905132.1 methyltransferase domain-containing protein [Rhodococcus sp. ARC_M6]